MMMGLGALVHSRHRLGRPCPKGNRQVAAMFPQKCCRVCPATPGGPSTPCSPRTTTGDIGDQSHGHTYGFTSSPGPTTLELGHVSRHMTVERDVPDVHGWDHDLGARLDGQALGQGVVGTLAVWVRVGLQACPLVVCSTDLRQAFDYVSPATVAECLRFWRFPSKQPFHQHGGCALGSSDDAGVPHGAEHSSRRSRVTMVLQPGGAHHHGGGGAVAS